MNYKLINKEVLYTTDAITSVDSRDIKRLKEMAAGNPRKRVRLCCHGDTKNTLHEMLIVHAKGAYVPPHKHRGKSESFHMIEGKLNVILFKNDGSILEVIPMGESRSGEKFFYRLSRNYFHTVIPLTKWVVFHETTNGPFIRKDMVFASWAPEESDLLLTKKYLRSLEEQVAGFMHPKGIKTKEII